MLFRIFCLLLFSAFGLHADDFNQAKQTQQTAQIAKVAVEWLIFDEWVKPKPVDATARQVSRHLVRLRASLQTVQNTKFRVDIVGADNMAEFSFLYDREAKSLTTIEKSVPRWNPTVIYVKISPAGNSWKVEVDQDVIFSLIEIKSEGQVYYVSKSEKTILVD